MSEFLHEAVPPMPPMSLPMIEEVGTKILEELCPTALHSPVALDFCHLVEHALPAYGIHVYPASEAELGDRLAATDPSGEREITILLSIELWDALFAGGRLAYRPKATIAHELGHAVLHVPIMRRRVMHNHPNAFNRVRRDALKPYEDPEWQAWALAGCIVAPRQVILSLASDSVQEIAEMFGVSEGMMRSHMKRLKLARRYTGL